LRPLVACLLLLTACAPAHLKTIGLAGGGREMPELFNGGWSGRHLGAFNDLQVEPGVTRRSELVPLVASLAKGKYAAAYVAKAQLDAAAAKHALFCESPMCLVVFDRNGADDYAGWGEAVAIFELPTGAEDGPIGPIWLAASSIRAPGPRKWDLLCASKEAPPRYVHPDGSALYPARTDGREGFALFGTPLAGAYRRGFASPSATVCDEEKARLQQEPELERPKLQLDPRMLQGP
jgi:hypothetical protein